MSARRIFARPARFAAIAPYVWMLLFFLVPFGFVLKIALSQTAIAQPPYTPVFDLMGGTGGDQGRARAIVARQFQAAVIGQSLHPVLFAQPHRRAGLDRDPAADRLSHRLRHGAAAAALAADCDDAGDRAVLDLVPDPHLCLDQHFAARWPAQHGAAQAAPDLGAAGVALDRQRDVYRHRLFLSAVHDPAALCDAGEDGCFAAGGRRRSRRLAAAGLLAGDLSAVAAGRRRRGAALLHPDRRRVRDS